MSIGIGVGLSLLAAVFKAGKSISTKLSVESAGEYVTSWGFRFISCIFFGLLLSTPFFKAYIPTNEIFWIALGINIIALSITTLLFTKAFRVSDISIVSPLMALIPVMTTVPAWILLQEVPSVLGTLGIVLVTVGTYVLQVQSTADSFLLPFKRLKEDKGARYVGIGLLIVGIIPSIDKIGLTHSTPLLWIFSTHFGISIVLLFLVVTFEPTWKDDISNNWKGLLIIGVFNMLLWLAQIYAYQITYVAYVQAIKRVSILLSIIAGYYIFNEGHIRNRLVGGSVILLGIICIIFGG